MLTAEDVYNELIKLISPESIAGTDSALSLCRRSLDRIILSLRDTAEQNDRRIAYAAACDAFYEYTLCTLADPENSSSFKAGDISVKKDSGNIMEVASLVKESGLEAISDLLEDKGFGAWSV